MRVALLTSLLALLSTSAGADTLSTSGDPSPDSVLQVDETFVTGVGDVTDLRWLPDGRLVVVNKSGNVFVRPAGGGVLVAAGSFPVDTESEKGLLGLAVDPDFTTNRRLYFYYSLADAAGGTDADRHRVVVRTLAADGTLDPGETLLLHGLRGPQNHDGGALEIGTDRLLYVGVGDTGCNSNAAPGGVIGNYYATCLADDPTNHGGANGKILRIGLDGSIPPTNPLVGAADVSACANACNVALDPTRLGAPRPEVFAWGFRNPWRFWFDPVTGKLWVGDVGEVTYEEVTIVQPGRHHGWPWREGGQGYPVSKCRDVRIGTGPGDVPIQDQDCVDPVYYCEHTGRGVPGLDQGCGSITGGPILDDCGWPESIRGRYVFADYATGRLWLLTPNAARDGIVGGRVDLGSVTPGGVVSLRTGNDTALYVAAYGDGRISRISPKVLATCADTTTTTVAPSSTTSTTLAGSCGGLDGFALAGCQLAPLRTDPLCGADAVPRAVGRSVHARAEHVAAMLGRAALAQTKRRRRLLGKTDHTLTAAATTITRAARNLHVSQACNARLTTTIAELKSTLRALRSENSSHLEGHPEDDPVGRPNHMAARCPPKHARSGKPAAPASPAAARRPPSAPRFTPAHVG